MVSLTESKLFKLLKLEETLFALPFTYMGMILPLKGFPSLRTIFYITLALISARTAGMSFNRIIDRKIDGQNPRTKNRLLPLGIVSVNYVKTVAVISLIIFIYSAYSLNRLTFFLSPAAVILLASYSYFKRFSSLSHIVLGLIECCAPVGAWIAVTGRIDISAVFLGTAIMFWIAGIDIVYSIQDYNFDLKTGLFSLPAKFGIKTALNIARLVHFLSVICLIIVLILLKLKTFFIIGIIVFSLALIYQHWLVRDASGKTIEKIFFKINAYTSMSLLVFSSLEVFYG